MMETQYGCPVSLLTEKKTVRVSSLLGDRLSA